MSLRTVGKARLKANPPASGGNSACATRRVGDDQNGSLSFNACRRANRNAPAKAATAAASHNAQNCRVESKW